jgi:hypothetical protein
MSAANDLAIIRGLRVLHPMAQVLTGPTEASRLIEELLSAFGERDAPPMTLQGIAKRAMDVMNASSLAKEEDAGCSFGRLIADHMPVASEHMDWSFVLFLRSGFLPYLTKQMPPHRRTIQDGWASHEIGPDPPRCPFGEALAVCPALAEAMITILPFPILLGDQRVQNVVWAMLQQRSRISSTLFCKVVEMASPEALNENRLGAASPLSFTMTNYNHARGEDRYRHAEDAIVFMERAVPDRLEGVDLSLFNESRN